MNSHVQHVVDDFCAPPAFPHIPELSLGIHKDMKWDYTDRRIFQEIRPGVFLGPLASSRACDALAEHRITTLVAIRTAQTQKIFKERYPEQFRYENIDIVEGSLLSVLPRITPFIQGCLSRGERLLFYDETGNAKCAVVVCAYLMETLNVDSAEAYSMVKNKRLSVTLSEHERYQLQQFETLLQARRSVMTHSYTPQELSRPNRRRRHESDDGEMSENDNHDARRAPNSAWG